MKIGFFDSGVGGLTVLEKFKDKPSLHLIYFADFKNMPYGSKTAKEIQTLCDSIVLFLLKKEVRHIVIACSTATVVALPFLKKKYPEVSFFEGVSLSAFQAVQVTKNSIIGVMATSRVVKENDYYHRIKKLNRDIVVHQEACFDLASAIETSTYEEIYFTAQKYVQSLVARGVDTIILGCTHYGLIKDIIQQIAPHVNIITSDNHVLEFDKKIKPELSQQPALISYFSSTGQNEIQLKSFFDVDNNIMNQVNLDSLH